MIFPTVIGDIQQPISKQLYPNPHYLRSDQETQTESIPTLHITDTGAQYSSPSDSSDSSSSDSD